MTRATSRRSRRATGRRAPRRARSRAGAARWSRSARCSSRRLRLRPSSASSASASLRCRSSGSPWSHSSTSTRSRPKPSTSRSSARRAARGPSRASAAGTVPLRHPVSTNQLPASSARAARGSVRGRALLAPHLRLADRAGERAYPPAPRRARAGAHRADRRARGRLALRPRPSVSSVPNTVGSPSGRAASAKRTTP